MMYSSSSLLRSFGLIFEALPDGAFDLGCLCNV